ncbi:hypothetical protein [Winogradskyella aquimaris]|jgi:putative heme iron utilization protein|uniref:Uncharacterized protein n=1 Tax=Winogradskyella aquimaris TaxID=864074 RepID=A0ABU5EJS2_9FLAO|nr:hypothetical protein [Winogradskyella aquimaris]MDY2586542.1 hypothetical protein [Winogradskyella aquimaris]
MSNTKTEKSVEKATQEVQLVEGMFTPSEANHIINVLIEQKINFHKLQKLSMCEGCETADTTYENNRIEELLNEKQIAKDYISIARKEGYNVVINGTLNISFVK